ncbi:beta-ketoacyl-[acyl-carrier-protein] synthase family protein [Uliginosibacterium sp. H3]|uniref:Nodulation protein E n=1 Tax=Uliginosibacterium silvisoli TaxID=3114758 RepID=A0ABU6JXA4_9RHOO|nr:beta-ketoacyl-[acyl-carrier-protein] synthase family protein [Uliginosibacterium sp. H3]
MAVTGLGVTAPATADAHDFFNRLLGGESFIRLFRHPQAVDALQIPAIHCADFDSLAAVGRVQTATMDRYSQLGAAAAYRAWADAGLDAEGMKGDVRCGVSWGTGVGGTMTFEQGYRDIMINGRDRVPPLSVVLAMNNACASQIAIRLGLGSACTTYSVACASSAVAVGDAFERIRQGRDKIVVAGGSEAPLSEAVIRAWDAMRVLAPGDEETAPAACRPFHPKRAGLVLGEGGAALILEEWSHALERGAKIYAEVVGYGSSCDNTHLVKPDAQGQIRAIDAAMRQGGLSAADVGYVNAHGTATREGDPAEIAALREVFGAHAAQLPVSATKAAHGHLLGATGAIEALITVLALHRQSIPHTQQLETPADDCLGVRHVMGEALRTTSLRAALSNSFAFGGSNAVLAFRQAE